MTDLLCPMGESGWTGDVTGPAGNQIQHGISDLSTIFHLEGDGSVLYDIPDGTVSL